MKTIGITGGTGFVGKHLTALLISKGYEVVIFSRKPKPSTANGISYAYWDPTAQKIDTKALQQMNAVIHLAGEGVADKRWNTRRKKEILESRTIGTTFITEMLLQHAPDCKVFISSSGIGYYGADKSATPFTETSPPSQDFLGSTCVAWENASLNLEQRMRRVVLRTGIVLGKEAGAFAEFVKPVKYGIAPWLGGGKQIVSWIHIADLTAMYIYALEQADVKGVYNAVAPAPVSQRLLMNTIRYKYNGFSIPIPVPSSVLKIMLGEMSIEILKSATVSSAKIEEAGFQFQYHSITNAVASLLNNQA